MSNPAANINDGAIGYASRHLDFYPPSTAGSSGTQSSYTGSTIKFTGVMENIRIRRPSYSQTFKDESNLPKGSWAVPDFIEGSGTVQLPFDPHKSGNTVKTLVPGDAFNDIFDQTIGAEQFVILEVESPESQGAYKTQNITFRKLYQVSNVPATV